MKKPKTILIPGRPPVHALRPFSDLRLTSSFTEESRLAAGKIRRDIESPFNQFGATRERHSVEKVGLISENARM